MMEWIKVNSIDELPKDGSKFAMIYDGKPFIAFYETIIYDDIERGIKHICNSFCLIAFDCKDYYEIRKGDKDEHKVTHYLVFPPLP